MVTIHAGPDGVRVSMVTRHGDSGPLTLDEETTILAAMVWAAVVKREPVGHSEVSPRIARLEHRFAQFVADYESEIARLQRRLATLEQSAPAKAREALRPFEKKGQ